MMRLNAGRISRQALCAAVPVLLSLPFGSLRGQQQDTIARSKAQDTTGRPQAQPDTVSPLSPRAALAKFIQLTGDQRYDEAAKWVAAARASGEVPAGNIDALDRAISDALALRQAANRTAG